MTRSVEIPEAAVEAAAMTMPPGGTWEILTKAERGAYRDAAYSAIAAALPYLAPAGDGGLREALEQTAREKIAEWYGAEWDASEDKFYETYDGGGISCVDEEAMLELRGVRLALDLALAAHPTAPAVPQLVDREALAKALRACICASLPRPTCPLHGDEYARADAVLAVLAGEQEQVET